MPVPTYTVTCTYKTKLTPDVYDIRFTRPEGFTFKAGQFVLFDVPLIEDPSNIQTRAFSIGSVLDEKELVFVMKMTPGGRASRWIEEIAHVGSTAIMKGPFGNFQLDRTTAKEYLFIATSTGIAPFRPQIQMLLAEGDTRRMDLIFGVRSEEHLFWTQEFEDYRKRYPNFFLHIALSQPSDAWTGHRGRVQTLIPQIVTDFSQKNLYVCGSPVMTKEVKEMALNQWAVAKTDLHVEGYI